MMDWLHIHAPAPAPSTQELHMSKLHLRHPYIVVPSGKVSPHTSHINPSCHVECCLRPCPSGHVPMELLCVAALGVLASESVSSASLANRFSITLANSSSSCHSLIGRTLCSKYFNLSTLLSVWPFAMNLTSLALAALGIQQSPYSELTASRWISSSSRCPSRQTLPPMILKTQVSPSSS